jgi:hypothetical protein
VQIRAQEDAETLREFARSDDNLCNQMQMSRKMDLSTTLLVEPTQKLGFICRQAMKKFKFKRVSNPLEG